VPGERQITPETAATLAGWLGLGDAIAASELAELFEGVLLTAERLYAIDVERFEFDFLKPDADAG
jgi:hypothetical protein